MTVDFREIFRIGDDGIYFNDGKISFNELLEIDGYFGEEVQTENGFLVRLNTKEEKNYQIVFPYQAFKERVTLVGQARNKCGAFCQYLGEKKIKIKAL